MLNLKIVTPNRVLFENKQIESITLPATDGEITILPNHIPLFTLLKEGIVEIKIKGKKDKEYFAIGGGYFETDGKESILLVNRAYGQDEINQKLIEKAIKTAEEALKTAKTEQEKQRAQALLRRSIVDRELFYKLQRRRRIQRS